MRLDANVRVVEPEIIRDDYVTKCAMIEEVGPCARFTMVVETSAIDAAVMLVVRKMMIPIASLPTMIEQTTAFLERFREAKANLPAGAVLN